MKLRYVLSIVSLALLFVAFEVFVIGSDPGGRPWLPQAISGAAVFVALIASVIALHAADKKDPAIKADISLLQEAPEQMEHKREEILDRLVKELPHSVFPFHSARVQFRIVNLSDKTLHGPTVTFRLPVDRQHPHRFDDGKWAITFNSNLYNNQQDLRVLQFGQTAVISNSNLPYWNHGDDVVFWIRMALDAPDSEPFQVQVSINAQNAKGITKTLLIQPSSLLQAA